MSKVLFVLMLFLPATSLSSIQDVRRQAKSVTLQGPVTLTVGMSESAVKAALKTARYELIDQGDGMSVVIEARVASASNVIATGDTVFFKNGRLIMATARWPEQGRRDINLGDTLYSAMTHLDGSRGCDVSTKPTRQPGMEIRTVNIECVGSGRSVSVTITRGSAIGEHVSVDETIY
jgi:hypothetical protein